MNRQGRTEILRIGGEPLADLLPPELRLERKAQKTRQRLWLGAGVLVVVMLLGTGLAAVQAFSVKMTLAAEQQRSTALLAEQKKYISVRAVQEEAVMVAAAQHVGTSTEIDLQKYLNAVQATLPSGVLLTSVTIDSGSPFQSYAQASVPLQGARVATLSFTATSPTLPEVPAWLDSLTGLPGYADASPGSVTRTDVTGSYTVNITMHINEAAFTNRFAAKGK